MKPFVYHGTISLYRKSLTNGIKIKKCSRNSDFGQGFYTTTNYIQAKMYANLQKKNWNTYQNLMNKLNSEYQPIFVNPMIVQYLIDWEKLKEFHGIVFNDPDRQWAEFIYNNRLGLDFAISESNNLDKKYDYVYGRIADSKITPIINQVKNGTLDFNAFYTAIQPYYLYQDQLSFHNIEVLKCLQINDIDIVRRKKREHVNG